jgi:hypothetical protein
MIPDQILRSDISSPHVTSVNRQNHGFSWSISKIFPDPNRFRRTYTQFDAISRLVTLAVQFTLDWCFLFAHYE